MLKFERMKKTISDCGLLLEMKETRGVLEQKMKSDRGQLNAAPSLDHILQKIGKMVVEITGQVTIETGILVVTEILEIVIEIGIGSESGSGIGIATIIVAAMLMVRGARMDAMTRITGIAQMRIDQEATIVGIVISQAIRLTLQQNRLSM